MSQQKNEPLVRPGRKPSTIGGLMWTVLIVAGPGR
jgi:hypothetical protein